MQEVRDGDRGEDGRHETADAGKEHEQQVEGSGKHAVREQRHVCALLVSLDSPHGRLTVVHIGSLLVNTQRSMRFLGYPPGVVLPKHESPATVWREGRKGKAAEPLNQEGRPK